jgi:F420-dependent oxidoreductase-like protein
MKLSMNAPRLGGPEETAAWASSMERAGVDVIWMGEAYGFDAVSMLGFLAGRTRTVQLGSAILPIFSRSPALTAMTAAGLDFVSSGRLILGLGASGPQVVRSWHGVPFDRPLARTRESIEVCRMVWAREKLDFQGDTFQIPLAPESGTQADRPLKLVNRPLRPDIPIYVAALGPKNVALTAEIAEGWLPIFFHPDKHEVWADALAEGGAQRDPGMAPLETVSIRRIERRIWVERASVSVRYAESKSADALNCGFIQTPSMELAVSHPSIAEIMGWIVGDG